MRYWSVAIVGCAALAGCQADAGGAQPDAVPLIYEAVLRHELKDLKNDATLYVFRDGEDPPAAVLDHLRKRWPAVQPGSKAARGRAERVAFGELKQQGADRAEVVVTFSNGMDGRQLRVWLVRQNGQWTVERTKIEALS